MPPITISAALIRLLLGVCIFLIGIYPVTVFPRFRPITKDLAIALSNQTLTLNIPGHSDATAAAEYLPVNLKNRENFTYFWCTLFAACAGLAYSYCKIQYHIFDQLLALDEGAKAIPKGEKLKFHLRGVRNLDLGGWLHSSGPRDTYMSCFFALVSIVGALGASVVSNVYNWSSDDLSRKLEQTFATGLAPGLDSVNGTIFGSSQAHGSYSIESWSCQIAPLLVDSSNMTSSETARRIFQKACRDGGLSRCLLLPLLPLAVMMFFAAWRPEKFTFALGMNGRSKSGWTAVPLDEHESEEEEEDDPLAGFGGNAREQWLLQD